MESVLIAPAAYKLFGFFPLWIFGLLVPAAGVGLFTYIIARRLEPLMRAQNVNRFDRIFERIKNTVKLWLGQWKQPRYRFAGVLHILIFAGFIILSIRSLSMVVIGISADFTLPGMDGVIGHIYNFFKDYAATMVLIACIIAAIRRGIFKPKRYAVPEKYGKDHTSEAVFVLGLISLLMISESLFEGSLEAAHSQQNIAAHFLPPLSLSWMFKQALMETSLKSLQTIHIVAYYIHDLSFFFFLCFLPLGKHFHVITSFFNVFFMNLDKGKIKPVRYGVPEDKLDELKSFGVKKFEDFTWKNILDFYSCADCGRCSDNCPANTVGRPLSPRFLTIKGRDYAFRNYPLSKMARTTEPLIGNIYEEDEIWSCTTCGACEEECPLCNEYINKIVDLRRGMVDEGMVPQSLQKPLSALEKRGNPWGKMEKKRADWAKDKEFVEQCEVKVLEGGGEADVLYFVDSMTSYDDRMQDIAKASSKIMCKLGLDFGILGKTEKDSGHEVRRFGEEMLFMDLRDQNIDAIQASNAKSIITSDPHAFNALKKDYKDIPETKHISTIIAEGIRDGKIKFSETSDSNLVYTYHDPCYLGRHNGIYDDPRFILDSIPGLKRVEMERSRDRSFCCGGGGLMLFYEPEEEQRMGVIRVQMAEKAGANIIVTACPFCLANIEDAIKVAGLEGKIKALDLCEIVSEAMEK